MVYDVTVDSVNVQGEEYQLDTTLTDEDGEVLEERTLTMTYHQFNNDRDERVVSWAMTYLEIQGLENFDKSYSSRDALSDEIIGYREDFEQ